jgi:hypothetical protein
MQIMMDQKKMHVAFDVDRRCSVWLKCQVINLSMASGCKYTYTTTLRNST